MAIKTIRKIFIGESGQPLLLIVLTILALSASAGIWLISGRFNYNDNAYRETQGKMTKLAKAICSINVAIPDKEVPSGRSYCEDVGDYPLSVTNTGTTNLLTRTSESTCTPDSAGRNLSGWCGPYWHEPISGAGSGMLDGWGNALIYNTGERKIQSYGPDGQNNSGSGDDLVYPIDENIVTKGLAFYFDAAKYNGTNFPATGCATLSWKNLVGNTALDGVLVGFAGCGAASGWNGTGTAADPYRLTLDGTNDTVRVSGTDVINSQNYSTCFWVYMTNNSGNDQFWRVAVTGGSRQMYNNTVGGNVYFTSHNPSGTPNQFVAIDTTGFSYNVWTYFCGAASLSTSGKTSASIYRNSTLKGSSSIPGPIGSNGTYLYIGSSAGSSNFIGGSFANFAFYNRAVTSGEILQNCNAQKGRFSGASCP